MEKRNVFNDVFNIISLSLPLPRGERSLFVAHFLNMPSVPYEVILNDGSRVATVAYTTGLRFTPVIDTPETQKVVLDLAKYFGQQPNLERARVNLEIERYRVQEQEAQDRLRNNLFSGHSRTRSFREINIGNVVPLPNYAISKPTPTRPDGTVQTSGPRLH